jgi:hypothetical protein
MTTELTADQPELHRIFNLQRWAPASLGHTPKQPPAISPPAETLTEDHDLIIGKLGLDGDDDNDDLPDDQD